MDALTELRDWLSGRGLEVVLIILGSVLLARFVSWTGSRITDRIDARSTGGDALVRSEAAKHRHSLTQVLTWAAIVLIYSIAVFFVLDRLGVPVTGLVAPATVLGVGPRLRRPADRRRRPGRASSSSPSGSTASVTSSRSRWSARPSRRPAPSRTSRCA